MTDTTSDVEQYYNEFYRQYFLDINKGGNDFSKIAPLWPQLNPPARVLELADINTVGFGYRAVEAWDYQLTFAYGIQNCLTIIPNVNLISNIGFNTGATHTTYEKDKLANISTEAMKFPLVHMPFVIRDSRRDKIEERYLINFVDTVKNEISGIIHRLKQLSLKRK